jgi:Cu(I)/Ag(I) efflux system membrane fusion protein
MNQIAPTRRGWEILGIGLAIAAAGVSGYFIRGSHESHQPASDPSTRGDRSTEGPTVATPTLWTCSMHPQIQLPSPGKCPICGMDLIPVAAPEIPDAPNRLSMSESAKKLANIQTVAVGRQFARANVRMVGSIEYDEAKVKSISAWAPGRIERLYVDYTGVSVKEGDHLFLIYSPQLLSDQEELVQAKRRVEEANPNVSESLRLSDRRALDSAREKLRLYGLSEKQIEEIESRGAPEDRIQINSPQAGIVIEKAVNEGDYVQTGSTIYTVADLEHLWVLLDAYESDLPWLRYGQEVEIQTEAYPGEVFHGLVAFIDPTLDSRTRTVKIRVNAENPNGLLKPGMFVRGTVHSRVAGRGRVIAPELAGKWIGPMHPEIVRDEPGVCPICGMELARAEDLGYITAEASEEKPLVVPVTAVLRTGRRSVVYVEATDADGPTFEGREIVLGPRAGDFYIVESGLAEGERVVVNGSFNIDSALQIQARPSMMSPEGGAPPPVHQHGAGETIPPTTPAPDDPNGAFRSALTPVYDAYFNVRDRLAADDLEGAKSAFSELAKAAGAIDMALAVGDAQSVWMQSERGIREAAASVAADAPIDAARIAFERASKAVIALDESVGHAGSRTFHQVFCFMAFGAEKGASWVQTSAEIGNPYLGVKSKMLACGEITQERRGRGDR